MNTLKKKYLSPSLDLLFIYNEDNLLKSSFIPGGGEGSFSSQQAEFTPKDDGENIDSWY